MNLQSIGIALITGVLITVGNYLFNSPQQSASAIGSVKEQIASVDKTNAIQDTKIEALVQFNVEQKNINQNLSAKMDALLWKFNIDPRGITNDIPATSEVPKNAPLIKGVKSDGSPKNEI